MHRSYLSKKKTIIFLLLVLIISQLSPLTVLADEEETPEDIPEILQQDGVRIGVGEGSVQGNIVRELCPNAEIFYYEKLNGYTAVAQGKLDVYVFDKKQMELAIENGQNGVRLLDETVGPTTDVAFGLSELSSIPNLKHEVNTFIKEAQADGTLDEIYNRWVVQGNYEMPEIETPSNPKYHLTVATTGDVEPYSFYEGSTLTGYDIEVMRRFALRINADVEFVIYDWGSIIASVKTGKADIIASNLQVTPERAEEIEYSLPLYVIENGIFVRDDSEGESFIDSVKSSFEKTFIREDRYKLFLSGILTTILITVFSIILGTALGFLVYMACRNGSPITNGITKVFIWLIQGLPAVVLLMILYYIIFAKFNISGSIISVVAFTLVFGASFFGMLRTGVGAVDKGQTEAAYAMGLSDFKTFFKIILPQALPHFLPAYKGEVVALVKATAIVGYIAVQDVTKMSDIIRGRTYEAFFPLIATAIIYFALGALLTIIVSRLEININPKRRNKEDILKGVRISD